MPSDSKIAKLLGTQPTPQPRIYDRDPNRRDFPPRLPLPSVLRTDEAANLTEAVLSSSRDEPDSCLWPPVSSQFPVPRTEAVYNDWTAATSAPTQKVALSPSASIPTLTFQSHDDAAYRRSDHLSVRTQVRRKRDIGRLDGRQRAPSSAQAPLRQNPVHPPGVFQQSYYDDRQIAIAGGNVNSYQPRPSHPSAYFDAETSSLTYGSEHSSNSLFSNHTAEGSSVDPYSMSSSNSRRYPGEVGHVHPLRRHASVMGVANDLPAFPSIRSTLMQGMLTQDFDIKIDTGHRRKLHRRKEWLTRCIMLSSNARQAQGQLSSKLANLTGAETIGEANFYFDGSVAEQAFACLHLFKTHVEDTREDDRLNITSSSYVAVAETTNNEHAAQWGLRIAGYPGALGGAKSRAAEATQVEWTLRFDSKFRMLDWQTTLRALVIALTEAETEFRTGLKVKRSVASLGGASSYNTPISPQWSPTFQSTPFGNLTQQLYDSHSDCETSEEETEAVFAKDIAPQQPETLVTPNKATATARALSPAQGSQSSIKAESDSRIPDVKQTELVSAKKSTSLPVKSPSGSSRFRYSIRGAELPFPPPLPPPCNALPPAPTSLGHQKAMDPLRSLTEDMQTPPFEDCGGEELYPVSARSSVTANTDRSSSSKRCGSTRAKSEIKSIPDVPESVAELRWSTMLTKANVADDVIVTSFLDSASSTDSVYGEEGFDGQPRALRTKRAGSLALQAFESLTLDIHSPDSRVDSPIDPGAGEVWQGGEESGKRGGSVPGTVSATAHGVTASDHLQAAISTLQASCNSKEEAEALLIAARELAQRYRARKSGALQQVP